MIMNSGLQLFNLQTMNCIVFNEVTSLLSGEGKSLRCVELFLLAESNS